MGKGKKVSKIILTILLICFVICFLGSGFILGRYFWNAHETSSNIQELQEIKESSEELTEEEEKISKEKKIFKKYTKLYNKNNDLAGWIKIDGTEIDYPVMQTKKDEQFYIHRNFKKENDSNGLPFLSAKCDIDDQYDNFLIYGHHMKSGLMFTGIMNYKDESFFKKHPVFQFDTLHEAGKYRVLSAFYTELSSRPEAFRFYDYGGKLSEKVFDKYTKDVVKRSLYKTGTKAEYGKQIVTLVTCSYHVDNGRFVVVAARES